MEVKEARKRKDQAEEDGGSEKHGDDVVRGGGCTAFENGYWAAIRQFRNGGWLGQRHGGLGRKRHADRRRDCSGRSRSYRSGCERRGIEASGDIRDGPPLFGTPTQRVANNVCKEFG